MNVSTMDTRRSSSRGQALSDNTGEKTQEGNDQNSTAIKENSKSLESGRVFRRSSMNVATSSDELDSKCSSLQADAGGKLQRGDPSQTAENSSSPTENKTRTHYTRNKRPKSPEKPGTSQEQLEIVS
jgi:hypothetical protein